MRNILASPNREILAQVSWANALLAFDFDGTLAPIVASPDKAALRPNTRDLLATLAELYPVVVISGRTRADTRRRLQGIDLRNVIGNHGAEPMLAADRVGRDVEVWRPRLEAALAALPGVRVENKRYSVAIHYRSSRQKKAAKATIMEFLRHLDHVRVLGGKQVVNVIPEGAPHKGVALERECDRLRCDIALYVGDDDTDEDVFALDRPGRLLTIRVGAKRASQAMYCLRRQTEIDDLIELLIELRQAPRRRSALS